MEKIENLGLNEELCQAMKTLHNYIKGKDFIIVIDNDSLKVISIYDVHKKGSEYSFSINTPTEYSF